MTQPEIDSNNIQWTLENMIQNVKMKESFWNFQRNTTMSISFYKSGEINGTSFVKIPIGTSALINNENDDKFCFIRSILASLHPCEVVILIEFQIVDNHLKEKTLFGSISQLHLCVVVCIELKNQKTYISTYLN